MVRHSGDERATYLGVPRSKTMLKITIKTDGHTTTLELEGKLAGPWVEELEQCWRGAGHTRSGQSAPPIRVHLRAVSYVDAAGRELLATMNAQGVELIAEGCMMRGIVAEVLARQSKGGSGWAHGSRPKEVLSVILLLASLALGPGLRAEEKPRLKLTLREAIAIALKQNPQVQIAVLNLAQSNQDQNIARSGLLPQFLQQMMGYQAETARLALSPGGLVIMVMMPIVGMLVARVEARWLIICGSLINAAALFQMSHWNLDISFRVAAGARMLQGLGLAFLFIPINVAAFSFVPREKTNYGTGLINLARNIRASVGIATVTTLLDRRAQFH